MTFINHEPHDHHRRQEIAVYDSGDWELEFGNFGGAVIPYVYFLVLNKVLVI